MQFLKRSFSTVVKSTSNYEIYSAPVNAVQMNIYGIRCKLTNKVAIIDSGTQDKSEFNQLTKWINKEKSEVTHLLQTHAHFDHILGINDSFDTFKNANVYVHSYEKDNWNSVEQRAAQFGLPISKKIPQLEALGERLSYIDDIPNLKFGNFSFDVVFTPGHSAGHVVFIERTEKFVFGGDLIFNGGCGRTDLPGCNVNDMKKSLKFIFDTLSDDFVIYSGHGPSTTIGRERETNFVINQMIR